MKPLTPLMAIVLCTIVTAPATAQESEGRAIAQRDCGACHATGRLDRSRQKQAPAFRTLGAKYDVGDLAEALAEGISVGHPKMPQTAYPPDQVDQLIAYLRRLQPLKPNVERETR